MFAVVETTESIIEGRVLWASNDALKIDDDERGESVHVYRHMFAEEWADGRLYLSALY